MEREKAQLDFPEEYLAESRDDIEDGYYYLLDLERSLHNGRLWYWKPHRRGYTAEIGEAGIYQEAEALAIAQEDIDRRTQPIKFKTVKNLLLRV